MKQKVIRIGSSIGITISKEAQEDLGIKVGDTVETSSSTGLFSVKPTAPQVKPAVDLQILQWGDEFITKNRELLKRLKDK
jgi:antitoxin component of MazEF toxin-antitoxin module